MEINIKGPPFKSFTADSADDLWWRKTVQQPNQRAGKDYRPWENSSSSTDEPQFNNSTEEYSLDDWDQWFADKSTVEYLLDAWDQWFADTDN